ncbi:MAG: ParA family protein [Gemmatimonadetes bacterium]|nr:MAG: ParA family protein [Gemmatimonadota bacterium]
MACRIIAFVNQKGGCGKTATTVSVGSILAERGKKVLLVDGDPQQHTTLSVGVNPYRIEHSLYEAMLDPRQFGYEKVRVKTAYENLDLLPATDNLYAVDLDLASAMNRDGRMERLLKPAIRHYDYILIDSPPALSLLTINILNAAKEIFIVLQAHPHSYLGLEMLLQTVEQVKENINPKLRITGLVLTIFDTGTNVSKRIQEKVQLDDRVSEFLFQTVIRKNITLANSTMALEEEYEGVPVFLGKPINHYDRHSNSSKDYHKLVDEIIQMELDGS